MAIDIVRYLVQIAAIDDALPQQSAVVRVGDQPGVYKLPCN